MTYSEEPEPKAASEAMRGLELALASYLLREKSTNKQLLKEQQR